MGSGAMAEYEKTRWLSRRAAAEYLSMEVDHLKRHVKAGRLPKSVVPSRPQDAPLGQGGAGRGDTGQPGPGRKLRGDGE